MMKTKLLIPMLLLLTLPLLNSGCNGNANHNAYVATVSTVSVEEAAIGAFNDYLVAHPNLSKSTILDVRKAAIAFRAAKNTAIATATTAISSKDLNDQAKAEAAARALSDASRNLIDLIRAVDPKLIENLTK